MFSALRIRNTEPDRDSDAARFAQLLANLEELEAALRHERQGLKERCERVAATAAFAQERFEDHPREARLSTQIDDMTCAMKTYTRRMAALQRQIGLVGQLRLMAQSFVAEHDETPSYTLTRSELRH